MNAYEIEKKIAQIRAKKEKLVTENLPKKRKSSYISCSNCGSKISTTYVSGYDCPVCKSKNVFMSETIRQRVARYDEQVKKLTKEYNAFVKKEKTKKEKTPLEKGVDKVMKYYLEIVYDVRPTPDFTEIHGEMGGDVCCYRVYKNGEIYEK